MYRPSDNPSKQNRYDRVYDDLISSGKSASDAWTMVVENYLDGKPVSRGKTKITQKDRDEAFWSSRLVNSIPIQSWTSDILILALTRYMRQFKVANFGLLQRIALEAPEVICSAVRQSGLVLLQDSPRRTELDQLSATSTEIKELCCVLNIFALAHRERTEVLKECKSILSELSPFELLIYSSLYAFEHLIPYRFGIQIKRNEDDIDDDVAWRAINDLLVWKLGSKAGNAVNLTEGTISKMIAKHLSPFLFPSPEGQIARHDLRMDFKNLLDAQIELNSFVSRSADAFSYDESIKFIRRDDRLEIEKVNASVREAWEKDGRKLDRLHGYWFYRALEEFADSGMATKQIGTAENHEANRLAYIKAIRNKLRLTEVYGVPEAVVTETGSKVNVFQALLALELMSAFFQRDFLEKYVQYLKESGQWIAALSRLAFEGLLIGNQNRFPITWSDHKAKIASIVGWTVSKEFPKGNLGDSEAILDFWTSDWVAMSNRLGKGEPELAPELFERPVLKFGEMLVQLPWIVGLQNTDTAAVNNLRRLGARRAEARNETKRIEECLGRLLEERGFKVVLNWQPPEDDEENAGEVDLICLLDGTLIVMEIKSTFIRRTRREAWLHATTTLRKAGQQVKRKIAAVQRALDREDDLAAKLGLENSASTLDMHGLIVDTSIEYDHQKFSGFMKVSLEEVLIALRDDHHLLNDPSGILGGKNQGQKSEHLEKKEVSLKSSLYPDGFSAARFAEVIECELIWKIVYGV